MADLIERHLEHLYNALGMGAAEVSPIVFDLVQIFLDSTEYDLGM